MYRIIGADGNHYGPATADVLRDWIREGRLNGESQVLPEGATEWRPLAQIPELAAFLSPAPTPAAPAPPGPGIPAPISVPGPKGPARTNQLAVAGLVLGILAVMFACCCYGLPFNIAGLVCSSIALNQIARTPGGETGRGMAIAGLVLSILSFIIAALLLVIVLSNPDLIHKLRRL